MPDVLSGLGLFVTGGVLGTLITAVFNFYNQRRQRQHERAQADLNFLEKRRVDLRSTFTQVSRPAREIREEAHRLLSTQSYSSTEVSQITLPVDTLRELQSELQIEPDVSGLKPNVRDVADILDKLLQEFNVPDRYPELDVPNFASAEQWEEARLKSFNTHYRPPLENLERRTTALITAMRDVLEVLDSAIRSR